VSVTWSGALAWRLRQHLLDPVGTESVAGVVRRLGAVPAIPDTAAELAIRARRQRSRPGEVARALAEGRIIKTFAFLGATHLMTPEDGGEDEVVVAWFAEAGPPAQEALAEEASRLAAILDRPLRSSIQLA
jgi:DNA glycosylase AlkZ-like